jgi:hypothetical protein
MRTGEALKKLILVIHGLDRIFDVFKILFVIWIGFDDFQDFLSLLERNCNAEFQKCKVLWINNSTH